MEDVRVKEEQEELEKMYTRGQQGRRQDSAGRGRGSGEFKIRDAPWESTMEDFPAIGSADKNEPPPAKTPWQATSWGPKKKF